MATPRAGSTALARNAETPLSVRGPASLDALRRKVWAWGGLRRLYAEIHRVVEPEPFTATRVGENPRGGSTLRTHGGWTTTRRPLTTAWLGGAGPGRRARCGRAGFPSMADAVLGMRTGRASGGALGRARSGRGRSTRFVRPPSNLGGVISDASADVARPDSRRQIRLAALVQLPLGPREDAVRAHRCRREPGTISTMNGLNGSFMWKNPGTRITRGRSFTAGSVPKCAASAVCAELKASSCSPGARSQ
jgi:hypothetical protein